MTKHTPAFLFACVLACTTTASLFAPARLHAESNGIAEAKKLLDSGDHDQIEAGIQGLGLIGSADAVVPIVERVRQGLPPDLLETAILTLMALGQTHAAPVLFDLASHRRPEIRIHAIEAIVAVAPKGAEEALRKALSDPEPKVRSAAAVGLGDLKATGSVDVLFHALDRGNMEASTAIGKVLKPDQVSRLLSYLGKIPFRSLGPALAEVLTRKDVAERDKLMIVGRLQDVGTPEVKSYLGDFLHASGDSITQSLSRAILKSMQEIAK